MSVKKFKALFIYKLTLVFIYSMSYAYSAVYLPFVKEEEFYTTNTIAGKILIDDEGKIVYKGRDYIITECFSMGKKKIKTHEYPNFKVSIFKGKSLKDWRTSLKAYKSITIENIYEGIDLEIKSGMKNIEKVFIVKEGVSPEKINISLKGANRIKVTEKGTLRIFINKEKYIEFSQPFAYQIVEGKKKPVKVEYKVKGNTYGFIIGKYDKNKKLYIDPLIASTYLGGSVVENGFSVAEDSNGNIYVVGLTQDYTSIGASPTLHGNPSSTDVVVAKFNSDLSQLLTLAIIGGQGIDRAYDIVLDSVGNVIIVGDTDSSDFPNPNNNTYGPLGGFDAFAMVLNQDLTNILYSIKIGGSVVTFGTGNDYGYAVTVDTNDNIYLVGKTNSTDLPTTAQFGSGGNYDIFFIKLLKSGTDYTVSNSIIIGGSGQDGDFDSVMWDIEIDAQTGDIFIVSTTGSSDFPTCEPNTNQICQQQPLPIHDSTYNGGWDGFISRLSSDLSSFISTFLGGDQNDKVSDIEIVGNDIYVSGETSSANLAVGNVYSDTLNGGLDAFVALLSKDLSSLSSFTYLGGSSNEYASKILLEYDNNNVAGIFVYGYTGSAYFPVTDGAYDITFNGYSDLFISKLSGDLSTLSVSTFLGGLNWDKVGNFIFDSAGNLVLTGWTHSSDFPTSTGSYDNSYNGSADIFVVKITNDLLTEKPVITNLTADRTRANPNESITFTCNATDPDGTITEYLWDFGDGNNTQGTVNSVSHSYQNPGTYVVTCIVKDNNNAQSASESISIDINFPPIIADLTADKTTANPGEDVTFTCSANDQDGNIINYIWDFGDGNNTQTTTETVVHSYTQGGSYTISCIAVDNDNAQSQPATLTFKINTKPQITSIDASKDKIYEGELVSFTCNVADPDSIYFKYVWYFGDGKAKESTLKTVTHIYEKEGSYTVKCIVTDEWGLTDTAQVNIQVEASTLEGKPYSPYPENIYKREQEERVIREFSYGCATTNTQILLSIALIIIIMNKLRRGVKNIR